MALILRPPWRQQPPRGIPPAGYWRARGLRFLWNGASPSVNLVSGAQVGVNLPNLTPAACAEGVGYYGYSPEIISNRLIKDSAITGFSGVGTFIGVGIYTAVGNEDVLSIGQSGEGVGVGFTGSNARVTYYGVADYPATAVSASSGDPFTFVASFAGSRVFIAARIGKALKTQSIAIDTPNATTQALRMGCFGNGNIWGGTGPLTAGAYLSQALSDAEAIDLAENPWQLFEPQPRRIYALAAEGGGAVTGSLAATETGSDSAAFAGSVLVQGLLAAAEAGGDTAAIAAQVRVQGTLSATEAGSDTGAVVGQVLVQAALAGAEVGSDTAAIAGTVLVQGALAATEIGSDTAVINGGNATIGTLAATESGPDTSAIAGAVIVQAAAAATESGSDSASITGAALVRGLLAAVEGGPDASAIVGQILVIGLLSASESGSDTAAINAIRRVRRPLFAQGMSVFFNADEFACEASLGGNDGTVIFDEAGLLLEGMGIQTVEPTALCPSEQWPAASDGQTITIHMPNGSRNFIVRSVARVDDGVLKMLTLARL